MAEEEILADLSRTHGRRTLENGITVDVSQLDEFGLAIAFRLRVDGSIVFVDFVFADD